MANVENVACAIVVVRISEDERSISGAVDIATCARVIVDRPPQPTSDISERRDRIRPVDCHCHGARIPCR